MAGQKLPLLVQSASPCKINGLQCSKSLGQNQAKMKIGYARISTADQKLDLQLDELRRAGCDKIFHDTMSGSVFRRNGLEKALAAVEPGGEFIVWKLDRLGRSMMDSLKIIFALDEKQVRFRSLTESFDTSTAIGRGILALLASLAEEERLRIRERSAAGREAARRRGKHLGRPRKLTAEQIAHAMQVIERGEKGVSEMADLYRVDRKTLYRALKR